jgi:hypothetical protein
MRSAGHVACKVKKKDAYRVLVRKSERKKPRGRRIFGKQGGRRRGLDASGSGQGPVVAGCCE